MGRGEVRFWRGRRCRRCGGWRWTWCCGVAGGELGRGVVGIRFGRCRVHECGQGFTCLLDGGPHHPFPTTPSPHAHAQLPRDDFDSVSTNHYTFYDTTTYFKKKTVLTSGIYLPLPRLYFTETNTTKKLTNSKYSIIPDIALQGPLSTAPSCSWGSCCRSTLYVPLTHSSRK